MKTQKPWLTEPDRLDFEHRGLRCEIIRCGGMEHLCGYVYPPKDLEIDSWESDRFNVHGGVTYCGEGKIGFDCAHHMDIVPSHYENSNRIYDERMYAGEDKPRYDNKSVYRDMEYVKKECRRLADQILALQGFKPRRMIKRFLVNLIDVQGERVSRWIKNR